MMPRLKVMESGARSGQSLWRRESKRERAKEG
jgi:hypothetical protein